VAHVAAERFLVDARGDCVSGIAVATFVQADRDKPGGRVPRAKGKLDAYRPETARGGHAVSIVGYTADRFVVRNSRGTNEWGDKRFGYAAPGYAEQALSEAYGVSV